MHWTKLTAQNSTYHHLLFQVFPVVTELGGGEIEDGESEALADVVTDVGVEEERHSLGA